jgi:hypothetical protein
VLLWSLLIIFKPIFYENYLLTQLKMAQVKEACAFNYYLKIAKNKDLIGE